MADDSFHLIISGERGRVLHIPFSRKKLRFFAICSSVMALVLVLGCTFTLYSVNKQATRMVFTANTGGPSSEVERLQQQLTRLQSQLNARENLTEITDSEVLKEKEAIVQNTLDELAERNTLLDQLFQRVGIIVPRKKKIVFSEEGGRGGPFIEMQEIDLKAEELIDRIDANLEKIRTIPVGRPTTGAVTSPFGPRRDPFNGRRSFHEGMDFRGWRGEPIHATADGVVRRAGRLGGYGRYVELDHGNGFRTAYGHMLRIKVRRGQEVKRGDIIGLLGNSGRSTGPHLHYEIKRNGRPLNPKDYLSVSTLARSRR